MKRIRLYLLALVAAFSLCARADTNDNYTAQLSAIYSVLNIIAQDQVVIQDYCLVIGEMLDAIVPALEGGRLPDMTYFTNLGNAIVRIRDKVIDIEYLCNNSLPYLLYLESISITTGMTSGMLSDMQDSISELDGRKVGNTPYFDYNGFALKVGDNLDGTEIKVITPYSLSTSLAFYEIRKPNNIGRGSVNEKD